jgi:intein/homing endonuclease
MPIKEPTYKSQLTGTIDTFLHGKRLKLTEDSGRAEGDVDFLDIVSFVERFKLFPYGLYPVQKFIIKLYYNIKLDDTEKNIIIKDKLNEKVLYEFTEVEYLRYLYDHGRCNIREQDNMERHELILILGRRSGKSSLSAIIAAYELYKLICRGHPQAYYGMPSGSEIRIFCIANDKDQASIVYGDMQAHVEAVDYFKGAIANSTQTFMRFRTENDRKKFGNGGKCICEGSLVLTSNGLIPIEELGNPNGTELQPINITIAQEGESVRSQAKYFYNGGNQLTKIITTTHGYEINGTYTHRVKVLSEFGIRWKFLSDIKLGDQICINKTTNLWSEKYVDTHNLAIESLNQYNHVYLQKALKFISWIRSLTNPVIMTIQELKSNLGIRGSLRDLFNYFDECGYKFKERVKSPKFGCGSNIRWLPTDIDFNELKINAINKLNKRKIDLPEYLDEEWGELLGILTGDGTWNKKSGIEITGGCSEFCKYVCDLFIRKFGHYSFIDQRSSHSNGPEYPWTIRIFSKPLCRFVNSLGYGNAIPKNKHVPYSILRSPKSVVAAYLRGLFETDGTVTRDGKKVSFTTASKKLAMEVQLLLLNFGIVSNLHAKFNKIYKRYYYDVNLIGIKSHEIFRSDIRFITNRKNSRLNKVKLYKNREVIYGLYNLLSIILDNIHGCNYKTQFIKVSGDALSKKRHGGISYDNLKLCISIANDAKVPFNLLVELEAIIKSKYYFDKVKCITNSTNRVYDLSVPNGESFISQGFTNHNSTLVASFKSSIAKGLRGRGVICAILDEIAFFIDNGRCLKKGTLVLTEQGLLPIEKLGDLNGFEEQNCIHRIAQEGVNSHNFSSKFFINGIKPVKNIITKCGYELGGTFNHRIRVMSNDGCIIWKRLDELKIGDFVGIHRETYLWTSKYVNTLEYIHDCLLCGVKPYFHELENFSSWIKTIESYVDINKKTVAKRFGLRKSRLDSIVRKWKLKYKLCSPISNETIRWYKTDLDNVDIYGRGFINLPVILNEDYGRLLGILVGDGSWTRYDGIQVTGGCEEFREYLECFFDKLFGRHKIHRKINDRSTCLLFLWDITVNSRPLRTFLYKLGYDYSKPRSKHIPWSILQSPRSVVAAFLSGLFETDGGCEHDGGTISFCTVSNQLAHEVQYILLNFGIVSSVKYRPDKYILRVRGFESRKRFAKYIGFITNRKNNQLLRGLLNGREASDSVPNQNKRFHRILSSIPRLTNNRTRTYRILGLALDPKKLSNSCYDNINKFIKFINILGIDNKDIHCLKHICNTHYFWDPIISISECEDHVYDIYVPCGNQFVAAGITNHNSSARQIYRAMNPSLAQFSPKDVKNRQKPIGPSEGRMILISSPDAREGFLYQQYQMAMSRDRGSSDMLMIQAPTWEVNPTLDRSYYEKEYFKDPRAFMTEHGAEFSDRVRGWIEDAKDLTDCIDPVLRPKLRGNPREIHFAGVDFGLVNDGTSIVLTRINEGKIELVYHEIWYPKKSWKESNPHLSTPVIPYCLKLQDVKRLDMESIAEWFFALSRRFYIHKGVFDQWAGPVFEQVLHKHNLKQFEMRNFFTSDSSQMYNTFRMFMLNQQLRLYDWPLPEGGESGVKHSPIIEEILELQATSGGKNITIVEAPKIAGKHDDQSDAIARSVLLASEYLCLNPSALVSGAKNGNEISLARSFAGYNSYHRMRNKIHGVIRERMIPRNR